MLYHRHVFRLLSCLACVAAALPTAPAAAIGYYNLPGNLYQWSGYGNGGGYHACFVLGPSTCAGACRPNEKRLPSAPQPPQYDCYFSGTGHVTRPHRSQPQYDLPAPRPTEALYSPTPAAMRPQILR